MSDYKSAVVIPNWNGRRRLAACLEALAKQTAKAEIIVVDNGSIDDSVEFIEKNYPTAILLKNAKNLGFAGGVNTGIRYALASNYDFIALLNNDAVVEKDWLRFLSDFLEKHAEAGIVTSKMLESDGRHIDSTGDTYTVWGLPFPRGRGQIDSGQYDKDTWAFGASGGASLYRTKMLEQVGLFDEDFFAYYEDIDMSFRAQLAGWKVGYEPKARVLHQIGATSSQLKGFSTYQTIKNLPFLFWKNVPGALLPKMLLRFYLAYFSFILSALARGELWSALKGVVMAIVLCPKKLWQRRYIQKSKRVTATYIESVLVHDLPPNAHKLRRLRHMLGGGRR